jgi:hypothetical protein
MADDSTGPCPVFRPDHNGECLLCDEWMDEHTPEAIARGEQEEAARKKETRIVLRCPQCGYVWHAGQIVPDAYWAKGVTPASIAALCYCVKCGAAPPMEIVE